MLFANWSVLKNQMPDHGDLQICKNLIQIQFKWDEIEGATVAGQEEKLNASVQIKDLLLTWELFDKTRRFISI